MIEGQRSWSFCIRCLAAFELVRGLPKPSTMEQSIKTRTESLSCLALFTPLIESCPPPSSLILTRLWFSYMAKTNKL